MIFGWLRKGTFFKLLKQHAVRRALLGLNTLGYLYSYSATIVIWYTQELMFI